MSEPSNSRTELTGSRIRERRLAVGLRQVTLAEAAGISASYLNLIEHNRRRIGGKLLLKLARALAVDPSTLSEGADAALLDQLKAAARTDAGTALAPEADRIDELSARFPGWTALIAAQARRITAMEALTEGLRDRLSHDPLLAEAMHDLISSVAAIRSTADILVKETDLDPAWRGRFHRNLHEEAERLSLRATDMIAQFDLPSAGTAGPAMPTETVEAMFDLAGHHFPSIEAEGKAAIPAILARTPGMEQKDAHALAEVQLERYAEDAARLPLAVIGPAAQAAGFDPAALAGLGQGDVALVLRRLATLPVSLAPPSFGLAICDASGALLFRRRLPQFSLPRFGPGCPLWPLYRALGRVGQAEVADLELPQGQVFRSWSIAQPIGPAGFEGGRTTQSTMLLRQIPSDGPRMALVIAAGPGCQFCPRKDCTARR